MIAQEKKQAVPTAIEQLEDETAFEKVAAIVAEVLELAPTTPRGKAGFMQGSITYLVDDWDAPLPDSDWDAHKILLPKCS